MRRFPTAWLVATVALVLLFLFDPVEHGFSPPCLFHKLTGLNCAGCGLTRALHELLRGHLAAAFRDNALLVLSLPILAGLAARFLWQHWHGQPTQWTIRPAWFWIFFALVVAFTVLRNLPAFAWLSP